MLSQRLLTAVFFLVLKATEVTFGSAVRQPCEVYFKAYNLRNIVEWRPGNGSENGTRYRVQYAIYGEEKMGKPVWRFPRQCKEVVSTWCDLSEETSDLDEQYYARVKAVGKGPSQWKTTERFNPKLQTSFGPPLLEVATSERALHIKIKGPMRWQKRNTENANSMLAFYPDMKYNVSIYNNVTKQSWSFLLNKNSVEVGMLDYNTQYCVSARSYLTLPFKCDPSKELCVTTPKDTFSDWIIGIIFGCILPSVIALLLLIFFGCLIYNYVFGNKQNQPSPLLLPHDPVSEAKCVFCPPESSTVNFITFIDLKNVPLFLNQLEGVLPPKGNVPYASQALAHLTKSTSKDMIYLHNQECQTASRHAECRPCSGSGDPEYGIVVQAQAPSDRGYCEMEETAEKCSCKDVALSAPSRDRAARPVAVTSFGLQEETCLDGPEPNANRPEPVILNPQTGHSALEFPEEEPEKEGCIFVDWDPETCRLQIPQLSAFEDEVNAKEEEERERDLEENREILAGVYVRQSSEEGFEHEELPLIHLDNLWDLRVNMEE
nr:PREDICTED: interleukin-20 receptor subunit alpha-like isoform X1 [Lepisosteus oculatus]